MKSKKRKYMKKNTIKKVNKKTKRGKFSKKYNKKTIKTKRFRTKGMIRKMSNISRKNKPIWINDTAGGGPTLEDKAAARAARAAAARTAREEVKGEADAAKREAAAGRAEAKEVAEAVRREATAERALRRRAEEDAAKARREAAATAREAAAMVRAAEAAAKRATMLESITALQVSAATAHSNLEAASGAARAARATRAAAVEATEAGVTATMELLKEADIHTRNGNPYNAAIIHGQVVEGAMAAADGALAMAGRMGR